MVKKHAACTLIHIDQLLVVRTHMIHTTWQRVNPGATSTTSFIMPYLPA